MRRPLWLGPLIWTVELWLVVASPFLVAHLVGEQERSGWATEDDHGDPDGESLVELFQVVSGVVTFVVACLVVLSVELARRWWDRQRTAD